MADFSKREEFEALLAKRLGKTLRALYQMALDLLGDEPDFNKLTSEFWQSVSTDIGGAVQAPLESAVVEYLQQRVGESRIGIEFAQVNERAAQWAREYSFDLVKGITDNTRDALRQQIEGYYRDGRTLKELTESISNTFGPVRAQMIAITETTRAAAQGESLFEDELQALGLKTEKVIHTSNDDLVCEICSPKAGRTSEEEGEPPFHIRCRCWMTTEVVKD